MADENRDHSFEEFDARLRRLREAEPAQHQAPQSEPQRLRWGGGLQAGVDLIAGVLVGLLVGYGLDRWLGTRPWLMIVFFFLGSAAGMLNAYRYLRRSMEEKGS